MRACACVSESMWVRVSRASDFDKKLVDTNDEFFFRDDELQSIQNPELEKISVKIFVRREEEETNWKK